MTAAVATRGLTRRFGRTDAVLGLDLEVPAGSVFALLGANGAGKTTTLKLLMNLIAPTEGRALVLGTDSRRLGTPELRRLGYVAEGQRLPGWMTAAQFFDYLRPFYPTWEDALRQRLAGALALGREARLRELSRGTRMKVALLAALAYRPELVVLDEPFTGLDPTVRDELARGLIDVLGERPATVLLSSHDIDDVERLADWVGFMREGRLILAEPLAALVERFRQIEVVAPGDEAPRLPTAPAAWVAPQAAGRTLRFVDSCHDHASARDAIAAAFPGCDIRVSALGLREIFVILARTAGAPASGELRR